MLRNLSNRCGQYLRSTRWFIYHSILHADDPPERIARGVAVGMFVMLTPTIPFQTPLVIFLAWVFRANKLIGIPIIWISNPVTFIPIFYPCYVMGSIMTGVDPVGLHWWRSLLSNAPEGLWDKAMYLWQQLEPLAWPLWVGCLWSATLMALLSYYLTFHTVRSYRLRRWGKLLPPAYIVPADDQNKSDAA